MRKIIRAKPEKTPESSVHYPKYLKLPLQIMKFFAKTQVVFILLFFFQKCIFKQSRHTIEKSFYLKQIVPVLVQSTKRKQLRPCLKSITVQAKTIITGKSDEENIFPVIVTMFETCSYQFRLLFQPFRLQGRQPRMNRKLR